MTIATPTAARAPLFLALGAVGFLSSPALAAPEVEGGTGTGTAQTDVEQRNEVLVQGARQQQRVESPKATSELLDTPQTVTVISDQVLRRQNLLTLRDALTTIPGITFGAGEGGGGYGDSINLRGYSASNDITQDGVRDCAQYSRTDPFNLQQIEVYNGANSVFNGSGSVGGTINLVSKVPQADDLTIVSAAVGTDNYLRGTVDSNWRLSPAVAVRLNAMVHRNDVPGRDVEDYRRWGVAPAITFGIDGPTRLTLAYVHQRDDNMPIYGVPYFLNQLNDGPLPGADDSDYYGYRNLDEQEQTVDRLTATFHQDIQRPHLAAQPHPLAAGRPVQPDQRAAGHLLPRRHRPPAGLGRRRTIRSARPARSPSPMSPPAPARRSAPSTSTSRPASGSPPARAAGSATRRTSSGHSQTDLRVESGARRRAAQHPRRRRLASPGRIMRSRPPSWSATPPARLSLNPLESIADPTGVYTGPVNYTVTARSRGKAEQPGLLRLRHAGDRAAFRAERRRPLRVGDGAISATSRCPPIRPAPRRSPALQLAPQRSDEALFSWRARRGVQAEPQHQPLRRLTAMPGRRPRRRCGSAARIGDRRDRRQFLRRRARDRAQLRDRRARRICSTAGCKLTAALFRNERSNFRVPSNDPALPAGTQVVDGRAARRRLGLGALGQHHARMDDLRQLHLSGQQGAAERVGLLPGRAGRGLPEQRRDPRSAGAATG